MHCDLRWIFAFAIPLVLTACNAGPTGTTELQATNVYFQPNLLEPIKLSDKEAATIRQIVAKFSQPSVVEERDSIAGYKVGDFVLGEIHYAWQGKAVYIKAPSGKTWNVVRDDRLTLLSDTYLKALGKPPYRRLVPKDWERILMALDQK